MTSTQLYILAATIYLAPHVKGGTAFLLSGGMLVLAIISMIYTP